MASLPKKKVTSPDLNFVSTWSGKEHREKDFQGQDFTSFCLQGCRFEQCRFINANLTEALCESCHFSECDFTNARFNASVHKNSVFVNCIFRGACLFLARYEDCKAIGSDFVEADMRGVTLIEGDWSWANLRFVDLAKIECKAVKFVETDFYGCDLSGADLQGCDLSRANLAKANLTGADIRGAIVDGIDLQEVNLRKARIDMYQAVHFARSYGLIVE